MAERGEDEAAGRVKAEAAKDDEEARRGLEGEGSDSQHQHQQQLQEWTRTKHSARSL